MCRVESRILGAIGRLRTRSPCIISLGFTLESYFLIARSFVGYSSMCDISLESSSLYKFSFRLTLFSSCSVCSPVQLKMPIPAYIIAYAPYTSFYGASLIKEWWVVWWDHNTHYNSFTHHHFASSSFFFRQDRMTLLAYYVWPSTWGCSIETRLYWLTKFSQNYSTTKLVN